MNKTTCVRCHKPDEGVDYHKCECGMTYYPDGDWSCQVGEYMILWYHHKALIYKINKGHEDTDIFYTDVFLDSRLIQFDITEERLKMIMVFQ